MSHDHGGHGSCERKLSDPFWAFHLGFESTRHDRRGRWLWRLVRPTQTRCNLGAEKHAGRFERLPRLNFFAGAGFERRKTATRHKLIEDWAWTFSDHFWIDCLTSKVRHDGSWHDACSLLFEISICAFGHSFGRTRRDGRSCWLWRLVRQTQTRGNPRDD